MEGTFRIYWWGEFMLLSTSELTNMVLSRTSPQASTLATESNLNFWRPTEYLRTCFLEQVHSFIDKMHPVRLLQNSLSRHYLIGYPCQALSWDLGILEYDVTILVGFPPILIKKILNLQNSIVKLFFLQVILK